MYWPRERRALVGTNWISGHTPVEQLAPASREDICTLKSGSFAPDVCAEVVGVLKWKCSSQHLDGWWICQVKKTREALTHMYSPLYPQRDSNLHECPILRKDARTMNIEQGTWAVRVLINTMSNVNGEDIFCVVLSVQSFRFERHRNLMGVMRFRTFDCALPRRTEILGRDLRSALEAARTSRRDCQTPSLSHRQFYLCFGVRKGKKVRASSPREKVLHPQKISAIEAHSTLQRLRLSCCGWGPPRCCLRLGLV